MKTFYTERDIEDMAASGATEIRIDDSVVLTDVARDRARYLGLRMNEASNDRKTFLTEQDIEDMAASGATEIRIDDNVVLTDVARDKARTRGLDLREVTLDQVPEPNSGVLPAFAPGNEETLGGGRPSRKSAPSDPVSEKAGDLKSKLLSEAETVSEALAFSEKIKTLDPETLERVKAAVKELLPLIL